MRRQVTEKLHSEVTPRLQWERPVLRRLDASDAQNNSKPSGADLHNPQAPPGITQLS